MLLLKILTQCWIYRLLYNNIFVFIMVIAIIINNFSQQILLTIILRKLFNDQTNIINNFSQQILLTIIFEKII